MAFLCPHRLAWEVYVDHCEHCWLQLAVPILDSLNPDLICGIMPSKEIGFASVMRWLALKISHRILSYWFLWDHLMLLTQEFPLCESPDHKPLQDKFFWLSRSPASSLTSTTQEFASAAVTPLNWPLLSHPRSYLYLFFFFWPHCVACGILVPQPGIEPVPSAVKVLSPNHWTSREFPSVLS